MDINSIILFAFLLFAIAGFVSYEMLLITVWRTDDHDKSSLFDGLFDYKKPRSHGDCYDQCMTQLRWDPGKVGACASACKI